MTGILWRSLFFAAFALSAVQTVHAGDSVSEYAPAREIVDATGFAGTVLVYDLNRNEYLAGHAERVDRRLIPASTFKVFSSLAALETGVVADTQTIIPWDGVVRERTEINRDLDLRDAFRLSAVPHYQRLVRQIGEQRMQAMIDAVGYGNQDISGGIDRFWLSGGLRISPREQVDFLVRLYHDDLPFATQTMSQVKAIMINEQTDDYTLRAKTGWATLPQAQNVGWWVGWVERGDDVYFFAAALETTNPGDDFLATRIAVVRKTLQSLDIL